MSPPSTRYAKVKRVGDIVAASALLAAISPLYAVTAAAVWLKLGRPVIFRQARPGLNGKTFELRKFRTMLPIDESKRQVTNEERSTPFGQTLRSTSLDELPSLWNILVGDMSFVGPRPLRTHYLPRYSGYHSLRHRVRPGLTGLAQVNGRNALGWNERLDLDVEYTTTASLKLDVKVLIKTFLTVVRRTGVQEEGEASMSEFMGSGPTITCRQLAIEDLPTRTTWLNDPRIRSGITIDFTATASGMQSWFENAGASGSRHDYVCVDEDNQHVSMFGLINHADRPTEMYLYVNPGLHGRGYGRLTMVHLLKETERHGISELRLETRANNASAIALYRKFGFIITHTTPAGKHIMVWPRSVISSFRVDAR